MNPKYSYILLMLIIFSLTPIVINITKYKNVSLSHKTYDNIDILRKKIVPNTILSRSQTINILVNEKVRKLNGKAKKD